MKRILFCLLLLAPTLAFAGHLGGGRIQRPVTSIVLAQADTPTPAETATPASDATDDAPADAPQVGELVSDAGKVIDDWKNIGWLAGVIALINLLLNLLRFRAIETWLNDLDCKWLKPLIATLLGCALGGFSTYATGAGILNSIVAGAMAGLGSIGFHELIDKTRKRTTKPATGTAEG